MRAFGLAIGAVAVISAQAAAADARFEKSLRMLAPDERLEQLCDYTAMTHIRKDARHFSPDRAVANATEQAHASDDSVKTEGGAFRSRGKWYTLSYACTASPDHLKVVAFKYTIGPEIPETKWAALGLWD
jgi:hypothetical protein